MKLVPKIEHRSHRMFAFFRHKCWWCYQDFMFQCGWWSYTDVGFGLPGWKTRWLCSDCAPTVEQADELFGLGEERMNKLGAAAEKQSKKDWHNGIGPFEPGGTFANRGKPGIENDW